MPITISRFANIKDITNPKDVELQMFLDYIKEGFWQDLILPLRTIKDKKQLQDAKLKLPYVTISGRFSKRVNDGLIKHSTILAIDLDEKDNPGILDKRDHLYNDKYIHSAFVTSSGRGLCLLLKIDPAKHLEAFMGAEEYFFREYDIIVDTGCKDVSRPRYVSYDPDLYQAERPEKFTLYPKEKPPKKVDNIVFAKSDFESLIKSISDKGINLVDSYHDWMRTGFSFADKFGDTGRQYFHIISSLSGKYNPKQTDRQYDHCQRALGRGQRQATIAVFYYLCKQAGLSLYSERTKTIVNASVQAKKGGRDAATVARALDEFEDIRGAEDIINQVFNSNIEAIGEDSLIDQILLYVKHNHSLKKNEVTRYIEDDGKALEQADLNSIFLNIKRIYEKANYELLDRVINSNFTLSYNPLKEYFEGLKSLKTGIIDSVADTILSEDYKFTRHFFKKWIVSMVASVYGHHNVLMFILSGPVHGKGKTEFFRRMFPAALKKYIADISSGLKDNDLNILMTQKIFLLDDECGNKSKKDELHLKSLLSKDIMTLREPYGRNNVDLMRLATLGGTTNEEGVLTDIDNRRLLPVYFFSYNFEEYNAIDKDDLFAEAYNLYKSGYNYQLTSEDKEWLNNSTGRFQKFTAEYELIIKHFRKPKRGEDNFLSATEIKNLLETKSVQRISLDKIGKELNRLGYEGGVKKINGSSKRGYNIVELGTGFTPIPGEFEDLENL